MQLQIYTDGSCTPQKKGSWAFLILQENQLIQQGVGTASNTTCVRMEFFAALQALKSLSRGTCGQVKTDSKILVDTMNGLADQWSQQNWLKSRARPIPDVDLIKELHQLNSDHHLTWHWIRAHAGHEWNEKCDALCREAVGLKPSPDSV